MEEKKAYTSVFKNINKLLEPEMLSPVNTLNWLYEIPQTDVNSHRDW